MKGRFGGVRSILVYIYELQHYNAYDFQDSSFSYSNYKNNEIKIIGIVMIIFRVAALLI